MVLFLTGCGGIIGSGKVVSQDKTVGPFRTVQIASGFVANVTPGDRGVTVRTDDNVMNDVEVIVKGEELVVRIKPDSAVMGTTELSVIVHNDVLGGIDASGGSIVTAEVTPVDQLPVSGSGGSRVTVTNVTSTSLDLDASGGSQLFLTGGASSAQASGSGGSIIDLRKTPLSSLQLDLSGGSQLKANVSGSAHGSASGGSTVTLSGHPTFDIDQSGGSVVNTEEP
ncbi:MAG: DUF2807 domain-containing protein [Myxococcaceae bacterium]